MKLTSNKTSFKASQRDQTKKTSIFIMVYVFLFSQWVFLLSSSHGWWGRPALHLPTTNPPYIPSKDFSSVLDYHAYLVISCLYSWSLLTIFICVFSLFSFRLCGVPQSASPLPRPWFFFYFWFRFFGTASLFFLCFCCYFVSFLECRAQSPFLLLVVLCVLLPVSSFVNKDLV